MKIGLLTYHHTTNFGSLLQTYGLYKAVCDLGVDCEIIDYRNAAVEKRETPLRLKNCRTIKEFARYILLEPPKRKKEKFFDEFLKKNFKISTCTYYADNVSFSGDKYDTFLVGSDLVWDFFINGHDYTYMLDFVADEKTKVAYASSVGSVWEEKERVTKQLNRFSRIGTRENLISDTLNDWLDKKTDFVCDPTMLLEPDEWKILAAKRMIKSKYILCYFADKEGKIYKDAVAYGKEHNLPVYVIAYHRIPKGLKSISPVSIDEFLSLIMYAETVFTASYHGMLYSMYFKKDFYYYNRGATSRMQSISKYLDVESREGIQQGVKPIDYDEVHQKMSSFREKSKKLLSEYLSEK